MDPVGAALEQATSALGDLPVRYRRERDDDIAASDFVFECTPERLEVKRRLCRELDPMLAPGSIFVSSTSALPVSQFTEETAVRERALVAHPFNPPHLVPVVELVPAPFTAATTVAKVRNLLLARGKQPVTLHREITGFAGKRLALALYREAVHLVAEGVISPADLETMVTLGLGLRWAAAGPSETYELNQNESFAIYFARIEQHLRDVVGALDNAPMLDPKGMRLIEEH